MIRNYLLDCFIIKRKNYQEADKIITVFSKQRGKVILKAKGIRKISSKRAGSLELLNLTKILVVKGRGDMDVITEVSLTKDYSSLGREFYRTKIAYELLEMINTFSLEESGNEELFELLSKALNFINATNFHPDLADKASLRFKVRILELLGYGSFLESSHSQLNQFIEDLAQHKLVAHHNFSL